jgi:trimeric autotransporter adhesin
LSATATGLSNLTTTVTSQAGTISANAQDINAIEVTIGSNSSGLVQQINTVESSVNTVTGQISTLSSSVNQVNTTVNGLSTTVSQNSTSIDGIEGEYAVKIDSNGTVAGFGLINGGSSSSAFYVRADKFAIGNTAGSSQLPFIVTTSAQFLNGQYVPAGVYIQDAFIKNGVITSAKIGLLAVDTAQMANLAVTTGKIDNLAVTGAKIDNATITTAKIGDAQITSALIGDLQVDTLKIANQAVTVPSGVNQDTFLTLSTAWQTVCSITVNMGTGVQAVLVSAFHNFQNTSQTSTQYDIAMKIEANGSGGGSVAQTHNNQTSVLSSMAKYGALTGNVLFTIRVKKNASAGTYLARNSGLLVQGIKK